MNIIDVDWLPEEDMIVVTIKLPGKDTCIHMLTAEEAISLARNIDGMLQVREGD